MPPNISQQTALFRVQRAVLWQGQQSGRQVRFPATTPKNRRKFWPLLFPHTGPGSEPISPASRSPPLLIIPMAPRCLSAGITLMKCIHPFPPAICLAASCPFRACSQTSAVTPTKERRKSWPGIQWPKEEGLPGAIPQLECHAPCISWPSGTRAGARDTLQVPTGEPLVQKTILDRGLQTGVLDPKDCTGRHRPDPERGGLTPKGPQILRDLKGVVQMQNKT